LGTLFLFPPSVSGMCFRANILWFDNHHVLFFLSAFNDQLGVSVHHTANFFYLFNLFHLCFDFDFISTFTDMRLLICRLPLMWFMIKMLLSIHGRKTEVSFHWWRISICFVCFHFCTVPICFLPWLCAQSVFSLNIMYLKCDLMDGYIIGLLYMFICLSLRLIFAHFCFFWINMVVV
jgi:hypothetical protein